MEWFYGLLIGATFTAILMHLAHRGHKEEREVVKTDATATLDFDFPLPKPRDNVRADVAAHLQRGVTVRSLEDVPMDCTCDWQENKMICDKEGDWYRTMRDPQCPRHRADDEWLTSLPKNHTEEQFQRWVKQAERY